MPARLVALDLPPDDAFVVALDEVWSAGDAVLPLDPYAPPAVRDAMSAALGVGGPIDDDVALVIATSGSTGQPKGAQLTRAALDASARATMQRLGTRPDDHWLSCLPWHHIGGLQVLLRARLMGAPLTIHDRFDVDRFAAETMPTLTSLVPTQLQRLLDAGVDLTRYRTILLGGSAAPKALLRNAKAAGVHIVTTYGMSETAGGCVYDGVPLDGVDVRVDDEGRIAIRGPMLMSGYRGQDPQAALVDGWLTTNDTGELDEDGHLTVHGRLDDVIVSGGENVAATDVADVLRRHPAIADLAVTGIADDEWGQSVIAIVVLRNDTALTLDDIRGWASSRLPRAAVPRGLVVVESIPLLASGKPDRGALRALAQAAGTGLGPRSHSAAPPSA